MYVRFSMMCLLDALGPSSYASHTGLTTGGSGVYTPEEPISHARANQRAALGRCDPSLGGAIGWSGAGSER